MMTGLKTIVGVNTNGLKSEYGMPQTRSYEDCVRRLHEDGFMTEEEYKNWYKIAENILENKGMGDVSDGYHTFNELYHHRALLFASLCNSFPEKAWKSKFHHDPSEPMYDGMFIVGIETPNGQATYHYDIDPYWDMFKVAELARAPKWDGHTPAEAIERIYTAFLPHMVARLHFNMVDDFTSACDSYLKTSVTEGMKFETTYWIDDTIHMTKDNMVAIPFRYPGATRGHVLITIPDGTIQDIQFYDIATMHDIGCYSTGIMMLKDVWKGKQLKSLANIVSALHGFMNLDGRTKL